MRLMTIDQIAQHAGIPVSTVRLYQNKGLLPPPERRGRVGYYDAGHRGRLPGDDPRDALVVEQAETEERSQDVAIEAVRDRGGRRWLAGLPAASHADAAVGRLRVVKQVVTGATDPRVGTVELHRRIVGRNGVRLLATRSGVDPMPVDVIQDLKRRLAQEN